MRKSVPWEKIVHGDVVTEGLFGTEYKVPNLGRVWVGKNDVKEVADRGDSLLCNLVSLPDDPPEERMWAIVGFQASHFPDMSSPNDHKDD